MIDLKALYGTMATMAAASGTWLDIAEPIVTIAVTVIVGSLTAWYTWERAIKLKREREDDKGGDKRSERDSPK